MSEKGRAVWSSRDKVPCRQNGVDCSERHPGCQDHCERMLEAKRINDARKAIEREKRAAIHAVQEHGVKQAAKASGKKLPQR